MNILRVFIVVFFVFFSTGSYSSYVKNDLNKKSLYTCINSEIPSFRFDLSWGDGSRSGTVTVTDQKGALTAPAFVSEFNMNGLNYRRFDFEPNSKGEYDLALIVNTSNKTAALFNYTGLKAGEMKEPDLFFYCSVYF